VNIGVQLLSPVVLFLLIIPGLISTSSQSLRTPLIKVPPAIPPTRSLLSTPGKLTSNDLISILVLFISLLTLQQ